MPVPVYIECWNCGFSYSAEYDTCPRCGESRSDEPIEDMLFVIPSPSPIVFEELKGHETRLALAAYKKYIDLKKTGEHPGLIFVRSYAKSARGWMIEFSHRTLSSREYLLAPAGLKLGRTA